MKFRNYSILIAFALLAASLPAFADKPPKAPKPHKPKKEIVHFFAQERMINQGIVSNATGRVDIHLNSVSKGKPLEIRVAVADLDPNLTYHLQAMIGDETNLTEIVEFTTDNEGGAKLAFRDKAVGKPSKNPVPGSLNPISNVHQLAITDGTNVVLLADLQSPNKFEYLLKRDISSGDIVALLQIDGHPNKARVRLSASGLDAGADYSLALNGAIVTTGTADGHGHLKLGWDLESPLDVLSVESIALLNAAGETVVFTTLP